jgi:alpha-galactosidase/6-phospho-beta-glucosidase family protein
MTGETKVDVTENNGNEIDNPTVEELMAQLAQANADRDRYKSANDKLSKSEAEMKRQLRAKQSEDERLSAEQAEAQRLRDEEFEATKAELNRMKAANAYKSISAEKEVAKLIEAVTNADHATIALIIENEKKAAVKAAEAEWLQSRPQANIGVGSTMTKDQIMAITDREERLKAIALNQNLFN